MKWDRQRKRTFTSATFEKNTQTKLSELETKMETIADVVDYQLMNKSGRITFICGMNHRYQKV